MSSEPKQKTAGPKPWWHEGVQFACQGSGKCCVTYGANAYVYVTLADRQRLAATMNIPTRQFTRQYCAKLDGLFHLVTAGAPCIFLEGRRCSVYAGRPTQCRTWPFWPENMRPAQWSRVAAFCPGIGQGSAVPAETIREILEQQRRSTDAL